MSEVTERDALNGPAASDQLTQETEWVELSRPRPHSTHCTHKDTHRPAQTLTLAG